jgi:uncharacterized membrane protein
MHDSVTMQISAPADEVWGLISDITNTGKFSPETFEAQWLDGATGPAVGTTFRGHVKRNGRGPVYWTTCRITTCVPGADFGFEVLAGKRVANTWRYQLAATAEGCTVTESFALPESLGTKVYWALLGRLRGRTNRDGMRQTLERIKALVEQS